MARKFVATHSVSEARGTVQVGVHAATCKHTGRTSYPVIYAGREPVGTQIEARWLAELAHPDLSVTCLIMPCALPAGYGR